LNDHSIGSTSVARLPPTEVALSPPIPSQLTVASLRCGLPVVLALMLLAGCPGPSGPAIGTVDTLVAPDLPASTDSGDDTGMSDDVTSNDVDDDDVAADANETDTAITPGAFGAPCGSPDDCNDGWCLPTSNGGVCSRACTESCPWGWACRQNVAVLPNIAFVCMPPAPTYCRPCDRNADCQSPNDTTTHACIPTGDGGSFCAGACEDDDDCPDDAFCTNVTDVDGNTSRQCRPDSGECTCGAADIAAEASTTCFNSNTFGRCSGRRACESEGLGACDAAEPALDICNGADDNCNGETDEGFIAEPCTNANDHGSCAGVTGCGDGVPSCNAPEPVAESCNGDDDDCDGETDEAGASDCTTYFLDADGDGFGTAESRCLCAPDGFFRATTAGDCNDGVRGVGPHVSESCNGRDDNCNGQTDEEDAVGCTVFHRDFDRDGFGDPDLTGCLCAPATPFDTRTSNDCNDNDREISPAVVERCNSRDDNCDGSTDELGSLGCRLHFADRDQDDFGNPADFQCLCGPEGVWSTTVGGDCDDEADGVNPGEAESCNEADDDCNGLTDETGAIGCTQWLRDEDRDGFGLTDDSQCQCAPQAPYVATVGGDCNDLESDSTPETPERCDNIDNDCDGRVDEANAEGCTTYWQDRDLDGRGVDGASDCLCAPLFPFTSASTDDCDDTNPFIKPGATESCNARDDDCNGQTDEGVAGQCTPFYRDADGDGWGAVGESRCLCGPDGEFTTSRTGDCRDDRVDIQPFAEEICNGLDDDCDGDTDEAGSLGCTTWLRDADNDSFGLASDTRCLCAATAPYTALGGGDCDDTTAEVRPGATEACNTKDDDCDGQTDERGATGCSQWLRDTDGDGFGLALDAACLCAPDTAYRAREGGDCDDAAVAVNPDADEVCNGIDDDCNGVADDPNLPECTVYYPDVDGDLWGASRGEACLCAPTGVVSATRAGDCNDLLASVNPSATESCNDVDDDCDARTDEAGSVGCTSYLRDSDGDQFGLANDAQCLCQPEAPYSGLVAGDCADNDAARNPGRPEICNGFDDNCDNISDPDGATGCSLRYRDGDRDTFGSSGDLRCLCTPTNPWDAANGGDCNDTNGAIGPQATESCDGVDNDCDGFVDELGATGCTTYYLDADGDGFGANGQTRCLCAPEGAWSAAAGGDCDDGNALRTPGRTETCNGFDDDCDLNVDEAGAVGCALWWVDVDRDSFGRDGSESCLCAPDGDQDAVRGGDCDDTRVDVNAEAEETCDAIDNNCDAIVDESECGLPTTNWPTFMRDARRTGHPFGFEGPVATDSALFWKRQLIAGEPFENSPIIDEDGRVVVAFGGRVFRLDQATGQTLWTTNLPAVGFARASPTARVGGTLLVPAGNGLVLLDRNGAIVWHVDFGGAAGDRVTGSPLLDQNGTIYVVSNTHVRALDAAGDVLWATAIEGTADKSSDPAIGPDGRLYLSGRERVYALSRSGNLNWSWCPNTAGVCEVARRPLVSVAINEVGRVLAPMGHTLYQLADGLTEALVISTINFQNGSGGSATNAILGSSPAIFSTGYTCCNPAEYPLVTPAGANGARMLNSNLSTHFQMAINKRDAAHGGAVFDRDGDIFIGSNAATADGKATFSARHRRDLSTRGNAYWTFTADGAHIDGTAALGVRGNVRFVVFGDSTGTIYSFGK
jgi:outer membrane protein assembly factor BamB